MVVGDQPVKRRIRQVAEAVEKQSYSRRMPDEWREALAPPGTDWRKEFLETAPYLIVVFRQDYGLISDAEGGERRVKHYHVMESMGIACGFLREILGRPENESPYLVVPVGYPAPDAVVPQIGKKPLEAVVVRV